MSASALLRGASPVGTLSDLPDIEANAILALRLWCGGVEGKAELWNRLAADLGTARGREALTAFERMFGILASHGRRPLVHHDTECACVGADEAVIARFVASADAGDREDALLIASLLVRAAMAPALGDLAERVAPALGRVRLKPGAARRPAFSVH